MTTRPITFAASPPRFDWKTAMFAGAPGGGDDGHATVAVAQDTNGGKATSSFPDDLAVHIFGSAASASAAKLSCSAPDSPPTSWTRVPLLGKRSLSPPKHRHRQSEGSSDRASWDDAGGENADWAHNATLTDPCFHHPRSSYSRNVAITIDEDAAAADHLGLPVDGVTSNRRRPHRGAAPALSLPGAAADEEQERAPVVFFFDEDQPKEDEERQPEPEVEPEPEPEPVVRLPLGVLPALAKPGRPGSPVFSPEGRWQTAA